MAASDAALRPFDVVVVPFPYSDRMAEKRRPALIVSSAALHAQDYLWLAMITGAAKDRRDGDVLIRDLAGAGLPGASMVRTVKIATVEPDRILRRIGRLGRAERTAVKKAIAGWWG